MSIKNTLLPAFAAAVLILAGASIAQGDDSSMTFAVIGDYGTGGSGSYEGSVANMVFDWDPQFILTVGDNNYGGSWKISDYDDAVGKYWCRFMIPAPLEDDDDNRRDKDWSSFECASSSKPGNDTNFYPTPGNHDWSPDDDDNDQSGYNGYQNYFSPSDGQTPYNSTSYYSFIRGNVNFFGINSNCLCQGSSSGGGASNCDGKSQSDFSSWLTTELGKTGAGTNWNVIYFHHPPYNGGEHHGCEEMGFVWDAITTHNRQNNSLVISGHQHQYERILMDQDETTNKVLFLVAGISGDRQDDCCVRTVKSPSDGTLDEAYCYNNHKGALKVTVTSTNLTAEFYYRDTIAGVNTPHLLDTCALSMTGAPSCSFSENDQSHVKKCCASP